MDMRVVKLSMEGKWRLAQAMLESRLSNEKPMSKLLLLAAFLLILWAVLRLALAITGVFLHLLSIAAVIIAVFWIIGKIRGK